MAILIITQYLWNGSKLKTLWFFHSFTPKTVMQIWNWHANSVFEFKMHFRFSSMLFNVINCNTNNLARFRCQTWEFAMHDSPNPHLFFFAVHVSCCWNVVLFPVLTVYSNTIHPEKPQLWIHGSMCVTLPGALTIWQLSSDLLLYYYQVTHSPKSWHRFSLTWEYILRYPTNIYWATLPIQLWHTYNYQKNRKSWNKASILAILSR